jgi:hypothetical protein
MLLICTSSCKKLRTGGGFGGGLSRKAGAVTALSKHDVLQCSTFSVLTSKLSRFTFGRAREE